MTQPKDTAPKAAYSSRVLFGRIWRGYLREHWPKMALAGLLMAVEGACLGVLSWMLEPLFDKVFAAGQSGLIWVVGGVIFSLFAIRAVTSVGARGLLTDVAQRSSSAMQVDLLRHILRLDQSFFQDNPPGALIERVQGDTMAVQGVWQVFITGAGRDAVALISLFTVAVSIDWRWTLAALVGAPLLVAPIALAQRYIRRKTQQMRTQSGDRATRLDEVFHGISAVKLYQMEAYQTERFEKLVVAIRKALVKMTLSQSTIPALIDLVTGLGFFAVLVLGAPEIVEGKRTVGEFMSFFTAMALAFQPLRRLGGLSGTWQIAAASLERLYLVFDIQPSVQTPAAPLPKPATTAVQFDDVRFSYGTKPVLRGLSFTAEAGKTTALVGPSGAGKSSVFNLLTRLIDAQSGTISVGGVPVTAVDLVALRQMFASVSQDAALFDETIRENVLLGRSDISEAELRNALDVAYVSEFVDALPAGLDTPAGPRGSALSGGQRQRVAIARAVLRDAPILLLDEATSALDTASEAKVAQALSRLSEGRTTLVIAHRLSTVRDADKIVVINEGQVVEEGTHDVLMAQGGAYATLCKMQLVE
ncbi:ATP-binding cassette subfamily B protein [Rhodobacter aestuarii]|uniref:ATP-binding cassette, subfamily B/ATP-binding cassette, subfamily B, MsbA n=2 Tax=Rhodobacter aestuarii TaxID=453582 RepID=A0A1N7K373_9RHOB|nr:ATP-binding cassette subfamily B protein [Rhodobacter aestuarii]SIS56052.1 ATP-binding cassette, subfamily B/ATP-binding cassette, subfamily B, MsbA [Rhodobacter aestuarii]